MTTNTNPAILIIDGLPPSSSAQSLIEKLSKNKQVFYHTFLEDLTFFNFKSMNNRLIKTIELIRATNKPFIIVAVSFGAYVTAHSNELLKQYNKSIQQIYMYSPVARLKSVNNIKTLPDYLNKLYPKSNISLKNVLDLDNYYTSDQLLSGDLLLKSRIFLGKNDAELDCNFHKEYFSKFNSSLIDYEHTSLSYLLAKEDLPWM